jgi:hypothetical protein
MEAVFSINPKFDKTASLEVPGWINLKVDYSLEFQGGVSYLCWKVKNTDQIFRVQTTVVYENHGLEYSQHFILTLKSFREDYLEWEKEGFPEDWMRRYKAMFQNMIIQ